MNPFEMNEMPTLFFNQAKDIDRSVSHVSDIPSGMGNSGRGLKALPSVYPFRRKHILVILIACLGLAGVLNPSSSIATGIASQAKTRMISINHVQLALTCMGEGSPTVLLESDLATASDEWIPVQEQLAATTQVRRYDRAGLGQSDLPYRQNPSSGLPRTSSQMVDELHSLLHQAGIAGPYILVGHGFGALNVRLYAAEYPNEIAGLVLVDGLPDDLFARLNEALPPELIEAYRAQFSANLEGVDVERSIEQVQDAKFLHDVPGIDRTLMLVPVMMLTHGYPQMADTLPEGMPPEVLEGIWQNLQSDLVDHAAEGTLLTAERSGHMIPHEQPEIIVTAAQQAMHIAR